MLGLLAALSLAIAHPGAAFAAATQRTLSAAEGVVAASLTYEEGASDAGGQGLSNLHLTISRGGQPLYSAAVTSPYCRGACGLETFATKPLVVADLEANGEQEVVLELNSGGAHCCTIVQVFEFDPGVAAYRLVERDFGDPGAVLTDIDGDGRLEFESADDRFAYEFSSFAFSGLPVQVWRFLEGGFLDATRSFPRLLSSDAKRWFATFLAKRHLGYGLGAIAAWAADEDLLGREATVARTLAREAQHRRLRSADHLSPGGRGFIRKLQRFLRSTGYLAAY